MKKIKRVKEFIRRCMIESGGNWTDYFNEAVAASNGRDEVLCFLPLS